MKEENKSERFAVSITPEDVVTLIPCDHGETMQLKTLQELVGGPIEVVPCADEEDSMVIICNEEALLAAPRPIANMTAWMMSPYGWGHSIYGTVVLMQAEDEELVGYPLEEAERTVRAWLYDDED